MKVSVVLLLSLVSWVVAFPGFSWPGADQDWLRGIQTNVGKMLEGGGAGGLLGGDSGLLSMLGGNTGLLDVLGGESGGGADALWGTIAKTLASKGGDEDMLGKLKGIVMKGASDKGSLNSSEKNILEMVTGLLKGESSSDQLGDIKQMLGKLRGGEKGSGWSEGGKIGGGIMEGDLKLKILQLIEEKASKSIKQSSSRKGGEESSNLNVKCKEEILKKIEKEVMTKKRSGKRLEKSEILQMAEEIIEREVKEGSILKKSSSSEVETEVIEIRIREEIKRKTEESLIEELKRSGKKKEKLTSEELNKCSGVVLKKVKDAVLEKKKAKKLESSEILRIAEEIIKKEVKSGSLLKLIGIKEESSEEIEIRIKKQVTKVTEERLEKILRESGAWKKGKESLTSEEIQKCSEVITEKVQKEVIEKKKTSEKLEESEMVQIIERIMKEEIKSGNLLKIIGVETESSVEIEVSIKEQITKITKEKLTEELKRSGKESEKVSSEEWAKCSEVILKKVKEQLVEKKKGDIKLEESQILELAQTIIEEEVKEGRLLKEVRGKWGSEDIDASLWEKITKVAKEKLDLQLKEAASSGKIDGELNVKEMEKCNEELLKVIKKEISEGKKGGKEWKETELIRKVEEIVNREVKSGQLLVAVRGGGSEKRVEMSTSEKPTTVNKKEEKKTTSSD